MDEAAGAEDPRPAPSAALLRVDQEGRPIGQKGGSQQDRPQGGRRPHIKHVACRQEQQLSQPMREQIVENQHSQKEAEEQKRRKGHIRIPTISDVSVFLPDEHVSLYRTPKRVSTEKRAR